MTKTRVIWTALPNGFDKEKRMVVSVHVAPRLSNSDGSDTFRKLGEFPAFVNWPERLQKLSFKIEFDGKGSAPGILTNKLDPALWQVLFPSKMPVQPFAFQDHAKRTFHAFPVRPVLEFLKEAYGQVAAGGAQVPAIADPNGPLAKFFLPLRYITAQVRDSASFHDELQRAQDQGDEAKQSGQVVHEDVADSSLPYDQQAAQNSFFQAYRFYTRPGSQRPDLPVDYEEPAPQVPTFDFHQLVAQLGDHPELLRRLGLVLDLVVDLSDAGFEPDPEGLIRVVPDGDLPEVPPTCPGTYYELQDDWFGAMPNSGRMGRGLLHLGKDEYDLFQVDVDGAAMQVTGFASHLDRLLDPERSGPHSPDEATVPALRTGGLALACVNRADRLLEDLFDRRGKNSTLESDPTGLAVAFYAEDLLRGYRVDVYDENAAGGPRWFSLHSRVSVYELKDQLGASYAKLPPVTGEGYIKSTSASSEREDHPKASDDLYLHETLFGWEGWSLSVPRPGKRIVEPGQGEGGGEIARYNPALNNPSPLVVRVSAAERSLPRLRTGHTYRLRARTVDIAGNSRPFSKAGFEPKQPDLASEAQGYLRFEPVPSPAVLRRGLDTEGESLEHLVIRSNVGLSPLQYSGSPEVVAALKESGAAHSYAADSQRHLAAPKTSQLMAEQDGKFDEAFNDPTKMTEALHMALREEGTFFDQKIVDIATGQKTTSQAAIAIFPSGTPVPPRGEALAEGAYAYYPDKPLLLPYLPDPLAVGVALTGYDFAGAEVFHQTALFPGDWPALSPFSLRLSEGSVGVVFNDGVLGVSLPQGEVIRARLSSIFPDGRLKDFAIWQWLPPGSPVAQLEQQAKQGRHWMLTPFRWVTFTHAVQQPLQVPAAIDLLSTRQLGSTYAEFRGPIHCHAKSTGRLDVLGEWSEDIDLPNELLPRMSASGTAVAHQAFAFGFDIGPGENSAEAALPAIKRISRHEFGDTKYRRVLYHSVATTRFREFLPASIAKDPAKIQRIEPATGAGGAPVPALVHDILSSARPAAPAVLYVLPTFRWDKQDEGGLRQHVRHGKSLRVWLDRPWFSSGDGEQLAVVLAPGVKLPRGWRESASQLELSARKLAARAPLIRMERLGPPAPLKDIRGRDMHSFSESFALPQGGTSKFSSLTMGEKPVSAFPIPPQPTSAEIKRMLRPFVSDWGADPLWASRVPSLPPTVAAFPRHVGYAAGLTLEELPASVTVLAAAHDVLYDTDRHLWYCDIEVEPGDTYYPFVRLGLARYQPHSLPNAHLSRVVMTDFIQVVPDRTATVALLNNGVAVTVQGFAGRNIVGDLTKSLIPLADQLGLEDKSPSTRMRVALERRLPGIPGDLGWEPVGKELTLSPSSSDYFVTWTGTLPISQQALASGDYRLTITEVETYLRDLLPGDPLISTSPVDFVRERVVYADVFKL